MRTFCLVFILCTGITALAQEQIGKTKVGVRLYLKQELTKNDKRTVRNVSDHDSSITLLLNDTNAGKTVLFTYSFNEKGICQQEKISADKAEWIAPVLEAVLANKNFSFKKINEHQYISEFEKKVFLELPPEGSIISFNMFIVEWSRDMYEILSKSENGVKE
jgi:predicted GTPase